MDRATVQIRNRRQDLNALYRARYDQVSLISIGLSIAGMLVFGALMLLFLTRLGWDLKRLQERALAVAKGYRGPALPVTRDDEIGALERSVNRMQQELVERETQVELVVRFATHCQPVPCCRDIHGPYHVSPGIYAGVADRARARLPQPDSPGFSIGL